MKDKSEHSLKLKMQEALSQMRTANVPLDMIQAVESLGENPKKPLGKFNPWAWGLEPVRGCNLTCWHCPARLLERNKYEYMTKDTWISIWKTIKELTPFCRVELAHTGEPTLHPDICEFISIAREISPNSQIQITTNGTTLINNKITYKELFDAGINIVYVDMYAPVEKHVELAEQTGYDFFKYYQSPKDAPNAWAFHNDPNIQFIALSDIPDRWPQNKIKRGGLGTFLNNIDFESSQAKRMGIYPVRTAPERRCNQPMKYVMVSQTGDYMMCCQDAFYEADIHINVEQGVNGFIDFWFGKYMQQTRQLLREKNRKEQTEPHRGCR